MRILYDHQIFFAQRYGGVSRYFHELSNRLAGLPGHAVEIFAPVHINDYFRAGDAARPRGLRLPSLRRVHGLAAWVNREASRRLLPRRRDVDIFHETYYSLDDFKPASARRVVTVYDMIHERFPGAGSQSGSAVPTKKRLAVARADHVICISHRTRSDLVELLGVPVERTSVVHLGGLPDGLAKPRRQALPAGQRPYLLHVGARAGYKNFDALLSAYAGTDALVGRYDLVCFGGGRFDASETATIQSLGLDGQRVRQVDGPDAVLHGLYASASLLAYPSLYEGFGIPPLEAMAMGCPVACSNTSSLPEVVGDAAELFDPADPSSIPAALLRVLDDPSHASTLVERGHARAALFSWERCARETLAVYEKVLYA